MRDRLEPYHFHEREWDSYEQLCEWFEWEVPETFNMAHYVCDRWATERGRVALFGEDASGDQRTYTFWQVQTTANRLANYLRERGVERGDRVGINASQRPETAIAHIAIWKLGAVSIPLSTLFGTEGVRYRLDDAGAVACIVEASNLDTYREVRGDVDSLHTTVTLDADPGEGETDFREAIESQPREFETVDTDAEENALLIYTSGTTGDPKGVLHAHRTLLGHLPMFLTTLCNVELDERDVFWTPSEWAWIATLFDVLFPALFYGRPVLAYNGGQFDPDVAFDLLDRYGITNYFAPPTALRMMMQAEEPDGVDSVHTIASGGESLGQSIVDWAEDVFAGAAVHEGYGQTEANMLVGDCTELFAFREGKMGRAAPGHEVAVVDPETAERLDPPTDTGEIAVRYEGDPVCFKEYWNKPERTKGKVKNGWLLTEDLGTLDEDGYFEFVSRKDSVIISAGYRIGPVEIEEALATHEAIADAGVIGVPDDERGEVPKAFVVLAAGYEESEELKSDLRQYVRGELAQYEYPREIEFIDELPKTSSGKVRRVDLEERE